MQLIDSRVKAVLFLLVGLAACGDGVPRAERRGQVPAATESSAAWTPATVTGATEVYRWGCAVCDGVLRLSVQDVVASDDSVVVLDAYDPRLRIFRLDGDPVRSFGRSGPGPEEIPAGATGARSVFLDPPGHVLAFTPYPPRLTTFSSTGTFVRSVGLQPPVIGRNYGLARDSNAFYIGRTPGLGAGGGDSGALVRFDLNGVPVEAKTVLTEPRDFPPFDDPSEAVPGYAFAVARDGRFALGDGGTFVIRVLDEVGRLLYTVEHTPEATLLEMMPEEATGFFGPRDMAFDDRGWLWVRTVFDWGRSTIFEVFGDGGEYVGQVRLADHVVWRTNSFRLFAVTAEHIVTVIEGASTEDSIAVWRILF